MPRRINPNRMELLRLKKRLALARRGHKLMKDKFDELLKEFMEIVKETLDTRKRVNDMLLSGYLRVSEIMSAHENRLVGLLFENLPIETRLESKVFSRVGVKLKEFDIDFKKHDFYITSTDWHPEIYEQIDNSKQAVEKLIELSGLEHNVYTIAEEMEKTRRRVNALEQVLIPQLEQQIRQVTMKLEEMDREARTRVMKVKEMLEEERKEEATI